MPASSHFRSIEIRGVPSKSSLADLSDDTNVSVLGLFEGESFKTRAINGQGRTAGFDYLRISLAMLVLLLHTPTTTHLGMAWLSAGYVRPFTACIMPMFFALSGFLVTGSLQRSKTLVEFAVLRAIRLVPALFVEVMVVALILGPLLTTFTLSQYFTDPTLYLYALNIVGEIQYKLPGLFVHNPDPGWVNGNLWTIPAELKCYESLIILSLLGFATRWKWMAALLLLGVLVFPLLDVVRPSDMFARFNVPTLALVLAFIAGVTINLMMEWIPASWGLLVVCIFLSYFGLLLRQTTYLSVIPIAYITVYIGLSRPPKTLITATGDYSYGVYIYGFPIQQAYAHLFHDSLSWWGSLLFSVPITLTLAALSWIFVESKALKNRAKLVRVANTLMYNVRRFFKISSRRNSAAASIYIDK